MRKKPKAVCTVGLIIVNIAVFMVLSLLGDTENGYFMLHHGAMYEPMILENQEYYRFFTCMFLHFGIQHLLNNMVMLGALGWQLEPVIGKVKYLLIYFISGLGGSGLSFAWNVMHEEQSVSAGASGAIFGLMGALLYVVIANRGRLGDLSGKGMMLMVLLGLYCGMTSTGLMVLSQKDDSIQHKIFRDLPDFLEPGDLLVVNNSKVLPARIVGIKQPTGAVCELLLLRQVKGDQWECLAKPGKRMQVGTKVSFGDGSLTAVVDETLEDGNKYVTFYYDTETLYEKLDEFGKMPLPPYITKQLEDQSQYQTVYAKELGSAAAPTAGLHFTPELMDTIRAKGVGIAEVTLHVGLGTFRPVQEDEITDHKMHSEWYSISEETAQRIRDTKAAGHRVIAVGTTSCRTLEAVAAKYGEIRACSGNTSIFLYPGVKFNCIDGLVTNFHLPESTLIMLIAALYGYDKTMHAYKVAVEEKYRFFSFGDAMLIL